MQICTHIPKKRRGRKERSGDYRSNKNKGKIIQVKIRKTDRKKERKKERKKGRKEERKKERKEGRKKERKKERR